MAKAKADIRSLARAHTATAINTLAGIMREKRAPAAARVAAAIALLDRGWGKPAQAVALSGPDGGPIPLRNLSEITDAELAAIATAGGRGVVEAAEDQGEPD